MPPNNPEKDLVNRNPDSSQTVRPEAATDFSEVVVGAEAEAGLRETGLQSQNFQSDEQARRAAAAVQSIDTKNQPAAGGAALTDKERRGQAGMAVARHGGKMDLHALENEIYRASSVES